MYILQKMLSKADKSSTLDVNFIYKEALEVQKADVFSCREHSIVEGTNGVGIHGQERPVSSASVEKPIFPRSPLIIPEQIISGEGCLC